MATDGNISDHIPADTMKEKKEINYTSASDKASVAVMSRHTAELEARYQQLLEQKIASLEKQLAPSGPVKDHVMIGPLTEKESKRRNDEHSSDGATKKEGDDSGPKEQEDTKSRGRKIIMTFDEDELQWVPIAPKPKVEPPYAKEHAFNFIEYYKAENPRAYNYSAVKIFSKDLIRILDDTMEHSDESMWNDTEVSLRAPYKSIVYSWDKLLSRSIEPEGGETEPEREGREDLVELLDYIQNSQELKDYFENRDADNTRRVTSFKALWTLFPPGTYVVAAPFMGFQQLFSVSSVTKIEASRYNREAYWTVICVALDFDTTFGAREVLFDIKAFDDTKPITSLECYPIKFKHNEVEFLASCVERGKKFRNLCFDLNGAQKVFSYQGDVISSGIGLNEVMTSLQQQRDDLSSVAENLRSLDKLNVNRLSVKGQVIVDFAAWNRWGPGRGSPNLGDKTAIAAEDRTRRLETLNRHGTHSIASKDFEHRCRTGDLWDLEYALLPPRVLGYIPAKKLFAQIPVEGISPVDNKDKDSIWKNDLILSEDKKHIIRTLVENHAKTADRRLPDIVEGKGKGLVILLHGPPGVGKSLTAECVARATSKPLFTVGVADIGTESGTVEDKLNKLFSLAAEWDAVLLIDEADVFMEQRGSTDSTLERNALVSVLLRVLEYYEGILILTTNRVLSFDVAVQSRIHLAVMFHDLDEKQTQAIIEVHMTKRQHCLSEGEIELFTMTANASSLNGRQIRNVISSAEAMVNTSTSDRKVINWNDIKTVLNHTKEFETSLKEHSRNMRHLNEAQGKRGRN